MSECVVDRQEELNAVLNTFSAHNLQKELNSTRKELEETRRRLDKAESDLDRRTPLYYSQMASELDKTKDELARVYEILKKISIKTVGEGMGVFCGKKIKATSEVIFTPH